ncbi:plexin-A4-like [Planococcus citri]|uniref:plexin-A4-like n=1 Tax=Planococcus citri TaxID=170843 RepID=UPI0031F91812
MHFHNLFLTLIVYTLTFSMRMKHCNANSSEIVSEFFQEEQSFDNLAVDKIGGWVYVGSDNHIYQLSADLKLQIKYTLMEFNSSNCNSDNCSYTSKHNWDDCRSTLLELDYQNQQLISCHVCRHNNRLLEECRAHNIRNISEIMANTTEYVSSEMEPVSFIAPSLIQNSSALYCGFRLFGITPIVTIRHLDRERFLSYGNQIIMKYHPMYSKFIYGFNSGDSNYFLTEGFLFSQQAINSKVLKEDGLNLIEIRHDGQNYQFDDVPLICGTLKNEPQNNSMQLQQAYFFQHKSAYDLQIDSHEIEGEILFTVADVFDNSMMRSKDSFRVCAYNMSNIHPTIQKRKVLNGEIILDHVGITHVKAMAVDSINNHIVLFIGTEEGHLLKISIRLNSSYAYTANIYADITIMDQKLYPFPFIYSSMLFDSTMNFLYIRNYWKLAKIKIHNCDEYNTSYSCLSAKDPYCGWCFLSNRCCLKSQCHYDKNRINWISYDVDKYINTSSSPRNEFPRKAEWNVSFNLLNSHPFNDHTILCSFRFNNATINTTSVNNKHQINCPTPNAKDLPPTPINKHSIEAQLSVQTNLFPEFQKIEVEFIDCSTYKSCLQCVRSTPCNWHINEHKCADEPNQRNDDTILGDSFNVSDFPVLKKKLREFNCPTFYKIKQGTHWYKRADTGKKERIVARFRIPKILINETFTCEFDTEENKTIASGIILHYIDLYFEKNIYEGNIECETIFTYATPKSSITAKWSILWNGSIPLENHDDQRIILYKCANMDNQCAKCLDKNYECMWNSKTGECKYNNGSDVESDINNHWLNDREECLNVPFVIKNQSSWLTDNIYWIIIIITTVTLVTVAIFFIYCRNFAKRSQNMQRQLNKMGMEMIAMSQWVKRVVIENEIELDENESNIMRLPNVTIQYTSIPRFEENETVPKDEYELPPDHKWEIPRKNVILGKCLGEGQFGKVVEGKVLGLLQQNVVTTAAVKMLKNSHTDADMVNLVTEMQLMKIIGRHENVLRLLGCCTFGGPTLLITEYSPHGNLLDFLQKNHHPTTSQKVTQHDLSEETLITFALQIAKGMEYLASIGFVHRDLAARNILVFDNYVMKIADFGLARDIRQVDYYKLKTGGKLPVKWMAPETMKDRRHTSKSDVWSYGVLLWEIMTLGEDPYPLYNDAKKLMDDIESGYRLKKPANCSINTYCLMCKCWNYLPADRPEFTNIIKDLDGMLMNFDKTIEQPDPPSSNYSSTTESDDTDDETNAVEQPHPHSSNCSTTKSDNTDDEIDDLLKICIE